MLAAGKEFVRHVVPAVLKPMRVLWNEIIGFIFLSIAVLGAFSTWRTFTSGQNAGNPLLLLFGGGCCLMLFYYGWSSFRRAKKISRS
ncbi:MAG: hypothetical protein H7Y20_14245 [Bryobacteraceae bacterium]|nr:hypothetical protein [Bryobacteraceae bacterium]